MSRRRALATLGSAGLGLMAMQLGTVLAAEIQGGAVDSLAKFNENSRKRLRHLLASPNFSGRISAADIRALAESEGKSFDSIMLGLLPLAQTYARPPISNFRAGAVVRGASDAVYLGANLEFLGHPLGFTVHGEQAALANAYMHAEQAVVSLAGSDAPCGHCRQFMYELSPQGDMQVLVEGAAATKLSALLPAAFGPKDLGFKDGAFPPREVNLVLPGGESDGLAAAAAVAARKSYAPYTKAYSGVAIRTARGRVYQGAYLENAAFNPGLPPLQTALVGLILGGDDFSAISRVCLVEVKDAVISQKGTTEAIIGTIAPAVKLQVIAAKMVA
jgi:cytidine deaminase